MSPTFEADVKQHEDFTYLALRGTIDEDSDLPPLAAHIRGEMVVVNLAGVHAINNCGVRDWVRWLEQAQSRAPVILIECSPAITAQLNMVSNFAGNSYVRSVYLPYYCATCEAERSLLVDIDKLSEETHRAPPCRCDSCDSVMRFDDLEESYFAFVGDLRRAIPEELRQRLASLGPPPEQQLVGQSETTTSSFAGIPPTHPTRKTAASVVSAAALRRLRRHPGLSRRRMLDGGGATAERNRRIVMTLLSAALLLGFIAAVYGLFWR